MEKVAEVAPTYFNYLIKSAAEIRKGPFKEEVAAEMDQIIKTAEDAAQKLAFSLGGMAQGFGNAAGTMAENPAARYIGATVAGGIALSLAGDLYEAARRGLTKSRHWSSMLEANPDLAEQAKGDPNVKMMFETLHRFNPEFSGDPHVAANYVKAQLEYPADLSIIQGLVQSRKNVRDAGGLRPIPGMPQPKSKADLDMQDASTNNQKAQAFKNRQEGQSAYNERMGMASAEELEQARRKR